MNLFKDEPATPADDRRGVREICLDIERRQLAAAAAPSPTPPPPVAAAAVPDDLGRKFAHRLNASQIAALEIVLADIKAKQRPLKWVELVEEMNRVEPAVVRASGDLYDSIRNYCAERCGVLVKWRSL